MNYENTEREILIRCPRSLIHLLVLDGYVFKELALIDCISSSTYLLMAVLLIEDISSHLSLCLGKPSGLPSGLFEATPAIGRAALFTPACLAQAFFLLVNVSCRPCSFKSSIDNVETKHHLEKFSRFQPQLLHLMNFLNYCPSLLFVIHHVNQIQTDFAECLQIPRHSTY